MIQEQVSRMVSGGMQLEGEDIAQAAQWIVGAIVAVGGLFGVIVRWMMSQITDERKATRDAFSELQRMEQANSMARAALISDQRTIVDTQRDIASSLERLQRMIAEANIQLRKEHQ